MSNADRLFDDDDLPPPLAGSRRQFGRAEFRMAPPVDPPLLPPPPAPSYPPPLRPAQRACYEALSLALQEGHVFAAMTGPADAGKTMVLDAVLKDRQDRSLRCIRISDPEKVPARLAIQIEEVAYAEAGKPENLERHVVLAVDDAHTASDDLLRCLSRLGAMREPGRRVPQVLLVGRPELWHRLASDEFSSLARRIAIRAVLPPLEQEDDPWASLEQEVTQTMSEVRASHELTAASRAYHEHAYASNFPVETEEAGLPLSDEPVPPPTEYALFPDAPDHSAAEAHASPRRFLLPAACLAVAVAAFGFVLSFYDWPDLLGEMPWTETKKPAAAPFVFSPQGTTHGLPRPFGWTQSGPAPGAAAADPATAPANAPSGVARSAIAAAGPARTEPASTPAPAAAPAPAPVPAVTPPAALASNAPAAPASAPAPAPAATQPEPRAAVQRPVIDARLATPPRAPAEPSGPQTSLPPVLAAPPALPAPQAAAAQVAAAAPVAPAPAAAPVPVASIAAPVADLAPARLAVPPPAPPSAPIASAPRQVASLGTPAPSATPASPAVPPVVHPAPLPAPVIALLLRRGDEQTSIGDVFAARLLFERAAEAGSAQGALRLARSYDAAYLPGNGANVLSDPAAARRWYGRAAAMGDKEAAARLKTINEGR